MFYFWIKILEIKHHFLNYSFQVLINLELILESQNNKYIHGNIFLSNVNLFTILNSKIYKKTANNIYFLMTSLQTNDIALFILKFNTKYDINLNWAYSSLLS